MCEISISQAREITEYARNQDILKEISEDFCQSIFKSIRYNASLGISNIDMTLWYSAYSADEKQKIMVGRVYLDEHNFLKESYRSFHYCKFKMTDLHKEIRGTLVEQGFEKVTFSWQANSTDFRITVDWS